MRREPLGIILTADLAAKARGRAFSAAELDSYLRNGCGWVPANFALDAFGGIVTPNPFGSVGDLRLMPDADSLITVPLAEPGAQSTWVMGDLYGMDGEPWACDPRTFLKRAIADLEAEASLRVLSSFEHEFMLADPNENPVNTPFSLEAFLEQDDFGGTLFATLQDAGLEPEMWLPEFGRDQFEITLKPADALAAADRAIYLREITRHVARAVGRKITFSPLLEQSGGSNGVHVHLSLRDASGAPVMLDPEQPAGLSKVAGSFFAGIIEHAEAIQAITAPSPISYERLAPHRWSVGGIFLGEKNREAFLRICPLYAGAADKHARQYNLEYRATDVTANPWLVLGVLIRAGLDGIRRGLESPRIVSGDVADLPESEQRDLGIRPTPTSLDRALELFAASEAIHEWFAPEFIETFQLVKRSEIAAVEVLEGQRMFELYASTY